MHELKIIQDIFPIIEKLAKENHLVKVNQVVLQVGKLRQVQSDFLQFAFKAVAKNTIAEGAKLIIKLVPITVSCDSCQKQFGVEDNIYICPECSRTSLEIVTGREIILESVDGEDI